MKTALTELIEKLESEMGSYIPNAPIYKAFIEEAKTFLDKEKRQISYAFNEGYRAGNYDRGTSGIEYYVENFGDVS